MSWAGVSKGSMASDGVRRSGGVGSNGLVEMSASRAISESSKSLPSVFGSNRQGSSQYPQMKQRALLTS